MQISTNEHQRIPGATGIRKENQARMGEKIQGPEGFKALLLAF